MREILFRAKRLDNSEWVEGYYVKHLPYTPCCGHGDEEIERDTLHVIVQDGFSDWNMPRNTVNFKINHKTLGQYTGLKDSEGTKIFDGDVINGNYDHSHVIKFIDGAFCASNNDVTCALNSLWIRQAKKKVIGNIHDNPELLGE